MSDLTPEQREALAEVLYPVTDNPEYVADRIGPFVARLLAEREAEVLDRDVDRSAIAPSGGCDHCGCLSGHAHPDCDGAAGDALTERGRQLASERDDLIAQGVDPDDLVIPLAPTRPIPPAEDHR